MSYAIATSTADVHAVIDSIVEATWISLGYSADSIEWPNVNFIKSCGGGPWMRVSYPQWSTAPFTWSAGVVQNTTIGILAIQVFAPRNAGDAALLMASDKFRMTFERQSFGAGIRFREALGPNETFEPVWAGRLLTFPFEFIEDIQQ